MSVRERILQAIVTSDPQRRGFVLNEALRTNRAVSFSDLMTDLAPFIEAERDARDAAWARLVKATDAVRVAANLNDKTLFAVAIVEREKATDALRDLGVDVDASLGEP